MSNFPPLRLHASLRYNYAHTAVKRYDMSRSPSWPALVDRSTSAAGRSAAAWPNPVLPISHLLSILVFYLRCFGTRQGSTKPRLSAGRYWMTGHGCSKPIRSKMTVDI